MGTLFPIVCTAWMVSELALILFRRSKERGRNHDHGSLVRLNFTIYSSLFFAIAIAVSGIGRSQHPFFLIPWIGLFFIAAGLCIRWTAILTLRKYFTVDVTIHPEQQIVTSGLFRVIRHPAYAGSMLSFAGLALALANWISIMVLLVPISFAFIKRIQIEERALNEAFGAEYAEYCRSTWRLLPWIY
jgi:protein-S-isoprenylcysteine O-methyltransferase